MSVHDADAELLAQFVAAFEVFDDMCALEVPAKLIVRSDEPGFTYWRPKQISTPRAALDSLYNELPARFPPLYESLILSYRWALVGVEAFQLLPNEPAEDLSPLLSAIKIDPCLFQTLFPAGYVQFGRGPQSSYDPVCFDIRHRHKNGEFRVVQIDHEEILCFDRIREVQEIALSFRELVVDTIHRADANRERRCNQS